MFATSRPSCAFCLFGCPIYPERCAKGVVFRDVTNGLS